MKIRSAVVYSFVLAAILALGVGCAKKPNDAQMTTDILQKYSQDSGLSVRQISVQSNDGVVTLTGSVDNAAQREAAAKQAALEPGVKTVINNLQIGDAMANAVVPAQQAPPAQAVSEPTPVPEEKPMPRQRRSHRRCVLARSGQPASHPMIPTINRWPRTIRLLQIPLLHRRRT